MALTYNRRIATSLNEPPLTYIDFCGDFSTEADCARQATRRLRFWGGLVHLLKAASTRSLRIGLDI